MLGGSEDDLCRPTTSKEPDFQLPDAGDWPTPARPDNWTEREREREREDLLRPNCVRITSPVVSIRV